ncbi:MAG: GFA family protein [Myxococcales bacterium]
MQALKTYNGSCHCGAVRFRFRSEEITSGCRCNCSICIRKGVVMSSRYFTPDEFELLDGNEALTVYQFGDKDVNHCFCKTCGISPFNVVAGVPATYEGPAKPGDRRVNLGCIDGLDPLGLEIKLINGRSF